MTEKTAILTLPIKPSSYEKRGMYFAPLLADFLSQKMNARSVTFLNLIDSYKNQFPFVADLLNEYQTLGIHPDRITSDKASESSLYQLVYSLISKGLLTEAEREIVSCPCGKIDCLKESLDFKTGHTHYEDTEIPRCQMCGQPCEISKKKVLLFHIPSSIKSKSPVFPLFSQRDFDEFNSKFEGKDILVSKQRDTKIPFMFNKTLYNLDVDFFWANYASLWNSPQKIVLASQHSVYPSFLINVLHQIHQPDAQLMTIFLPYVRNKNNVPVEEELQQLSTLKKQLYLLYSLKFKDKTAEWHPAAFQNISRLSDKRAQEIMDTLTQPTEPNSSSFQAQVIQALHQLNIQTLMQQFKKKPLERPSPCHTDTPRQ